MTFFAAKRGQVIATILFSPLMVFFAVLAVIADPDTAAAFGISLFVIIPMIGVALVAMVIFTVSNWRCLACNSYLGNGFNPIYCPKCRVQLMSQTG